MSHATALEEYLKELRNPAPLSLDPEEENKDDTSAQTRYTSGRDEEEIGIDEPQFGSLRKRTLEHNQDPKYSGKAISRKQLGLEPSHRLDQDDASEENDIDLNSNASLDMHEGSDGNLSDSNEDAQIGDVPSDASDFDNEGSGCVLSGEDSDAGSVGDSENGVESSKFKAFSSIQQDENVAKGKAVRRQLDLWDKLLESRIHMQKLLSISNLLPRPDHRQLFKTAGGANLSKQLDKSRTSLIILLGQLLQFQQQLLAQDGDTENLTKDIEKSIPMDKSKTAEEDDEEIESDEDMKEGSEEEHSHSGDKNEGMDSNGKNGDAATRTNQEQGNKRKLLTNVDNISEEISKRHKMYASYRDSVISKWNEKTKFSSGKVNSKNFSAFDKPTLLQIKHVLGDEERLVKRTQLKRSAYRVLGSSVEGAEKQAEDMTDAHLKVSDGEIFDDDDFYHQLLKELIERKSASGPTDDPLTIGRQWLQLQRLRSKVKRKIDTKASKGRRVRYDVHSKLVSFMAPMETGSMGDQAKNDLFNSLFGRDPYSAEVSAQ